MSTTEGTDRGDDRTGTPGDDERIPPTTDAPLSDLNERELRSLAEGARAENRRLREEYARVQRAAYRRSAAALLVLGLLAVIGALVLPTGREILFILGGIGLFGGSITWFLTPERFVTATVGRAIYDSVADTGTKLRDELGLRETSVYVPVNRTAVNGIPVRLFVPQSSGYELPSPDDLTSLFVLPESTRERGIAVRPTAARLVREFERSAGSIADEPTALTAQLVAALVEQFELVDGAEPEIDVDSNRVTVYVRGPVYDEVSDFDHPIASFLGTGFAFGLDRPVTVVVTEADTRTLVTCRWDEEPARAVDE